MTDVLNDIDGRVPTHGWCKILETEVPLPACLGVLEQGAGERRQLLLAGAERRAALGQDHVQARRRRLHHRRQVRAPQRRPHLK